LNLFEEKGVKPLVLKKIKNLFNGLVGFIAIVYQKRFLIIEMAKRDIASQYLGSGLGFVWTFINPLVMIFIFWLVFGVGFKSAPVGNIPFVVWLVPAMAVWNTFSETLNGATTILVNNSHLVKKVLFPLSILPLVKLTSVFITHLVFLLVLFSLILLYRLPFSIYWIQSLYYFFAMSVLALGLSWITSSVHVFSRDTSQIVNVVLQFSFWGTPIFWDLSIMPENIRFFLKLNPMFYVVQGYRESFIYFVPFWQHWEMTLYFWGVTGLVFVCGALVFLRLRPHFADVL